MRREKLAYAFLQFGMCVYNAYSPEKPKKVNFMNMQQWIISEEGHDREKAVFLINFFKSHIEA